MITVAVQPRTVRILPRGNWLDESGPVVEPTIPEFLGRLDVGPRRATRADLADWLTDTDQGVGGLTARVFVNRCWYLLFGVGISRSLDDLGGQGEPPVHPQLLDQLAVEFYESGWDVKQVMKTIVMSRAYRQSSLMTAELLESFSLTLSAPSANATIARPVAVATVVDNDAIAGTPVVRVEDMLIDEAAGEAVFHISLDRPSSGRVALNGLREKLSPSDGRNCGPSLTVNRAVLFARLRQMST